MGNRVQRGGSRVFIGRSPAGAGFGVGALGDPSLGVVRLPGVTARRGVVGGAQPVAGGVNDGVAERDVGGHGGSDKNGVRPLPPLRARGFRADVSRFVVLFSGRTGSTFLMDALSTSGRVHAKMEYLAGRKAEGADAQHDWTRGFFSDEYGPEIRAIGFKVKDSDLVDPAGFGVLLRRLNVRVVHMTRSNTVKAVLSMVNSFRIHEKTGLWTVWKDEDRPGPMRISASELETLVKIRQRQEERLSAYVGSLGLPTLRITYEQLYRGMGGVVDRLNSFLGTSIPGEVGGQARTKKVTSDDLRESLTNFDELAERFAGTEIGRMLAEGSG